MRTGVARRERSPTGGLRRTLHGTAVFGFASIVQRSIGFALLPIYARILTPTEFGELGLIMTIAAAVGAIIGFGLETAVFRSTIALTDDPPARRRFVNSVGGFALVVPTGVAILVAWPVGVACERLFAVPAGDVALGIIGAGLVASTAIIPLAILRAEERLGDYLRVTGFQTGFGVAIQLMLVVVLGWGVAGWLLANVVTAAAVLVWGTAILRHRWSRDLDRTVLVSALAFGLPMIPHALSHWALAISDRAILGLSVSAADIGLYYIAFQVTIPVMVVAVALSQSLQPMYARATTSESARRELGSITTYQAVVIGLVVMATALLGPVAVSLILPPDYLGAAILIPWIALGAGLFGLYTIPMSTITITSGRNRWVWLVTVVAAAVNIGLNLALIPTFGVMAAAVDTVIGYAVLLVGVYLYMRAVCVERVPFEWGRIAVSSAAMGLTAVLVAVAMPLDADWIGLFVRGLAIVAMGVALSATGFLPRFPLLRRAPTAPSAPV